MSDTGPSFVGIDLAWVARNRTGLAVVDGTGRLTACGTARSDDDIARWITDNSRTVLVAAVDAPLVVPNQTGQREGENAVARAFGRYGAAPYPSSRSNPIFDPPRALTIAERFGWSVDPSERPTEGRPVCIEVYPHPAMVALFELGSVLPYKAGKGRTPGARRTVFGTLADRLESIDELRLDVSPDWQRLRATIDGATRQMHLEVIEDELDAILCAHLAWLWQHRPGALVVYGSLEGGYIVAPPAPGHPRQRFSAVESPAGDAQADTVGVCVDRHQ